MLRALTELLGSVVQRALYGFVTAEGVSLPQLAWRLGYLSLCVMGAHDPVEVKICHKLSILLEDRYDIPI